MKILSTTLLFAALTMAGCGAEGPPPAQPTQPQQPQPAPNAAHHETKGDKHATHEGESKHAKKTIDPNSPMGKGQMLLQAGKHMEAAAQFQKLSSAEPNNAKAWLMYGYALHAAGQLDKAATIHTKAATFPKVASVALYNLACVHSLKNQVDDAFATLDKAIAAGFGGDEHVAKDPDLNNIRKDARFASYASRIKANAKSYKAKMHSEHKAH